MYCSIGCNSCIVYFATFFDVYHRRLLIQNVQNCIDTIIIYCCPLIQCTFQWKALWGSIQFLKNLIYYYDSGTFKRSSATHTVTYHVISIFIPSTSKARREVANLIVRKNPHTPVYGVTEFVCLSVRNFDINYLRNGFFGRK